MFDKSKELKIVTHKNTDYIFNIYCDHWWF